MLLFRNDSGVVASHTEADGSLTLSLPSGKYSVTASKTGFNRTNLEVQVPISEAVRVVMTVDLIVDLVILDLPGVILDPPGMYEGLTERDLADFRVLNAAPKKRSWRCLYLWKCSVRR